MDLLDRVADYLENNMNLFDTFTVDMMRDDETGLTIRRTPSSPSDDRYLDDSRNDVIAFQILTKHKDQQQAINTLNSILKVLEGLEKESIASEDNSFEFVKCDVYTHPVLVERDARGSYIYSALFRAEIYVKN